MASEWYCLIDGIEYGPETAEQLRQMALRGRLSRCDSIRKGSTGDWVPASRVKGLFTDMDGALKRVEPPDRSGDSAPPSALTSPIEGNPKIDAPPTWTANDSAGRIDQAKGSRGTPPARNVDRSLGARVLLWWIICGALGGAAGVLTRVAVLPQRQHLDGSAALIWILGWSLAGAIAWASSKLPGAIGGAIVGLIASWLVVSVLSPVIWRSDHIFLTALAAGSSIPALLMVGVPLCGVVVGAVIGRKRPSENRRKPPKSEVDASSFRAMGRHSISPTRASFIGACALVVALVPVILWMNRPGAGPEGTRPRHDPTAQLTPPFVDVTPNHGWPADSILPQDYAFMALAKATRPLDLVNAAPQLRANIEGDHVVLSSGRDTVQGLYGKGLRFQQQNEGNVLHGTFVMHLIWHPEPFACYRDGRLLGVWDSHGKRMRRALQGEALASLVPTPAGPVPQPPFRPAGQRIPGAEPPIRLRIAGQPFALQGETLKAVAEGTIKAYEKGGAFYGEVSGTFGVVPPGKADWEFAIRGKDGQPLVLRQSGTGFSDWLWDEQPYEIVNKLGEIVYRYPR